jgi:hypothetical protein
MGTLWVNGNLTVGSNQAWTMNTQDQDRLHFLHNNTNKDNTGDDVGRVSMAGDGNLWLSRQLYKGWVADNLQNVLVIRDRAIADKKKRDEEAAAAIIAAELAARLKRELEERAAQLKREADALAAKLKKEAEERAAQVKREAEAAAKREAENARRAAENAANAARNAANNAGRSIRRWFR